MKTNLRYILILFFSLMSVSSTAYAAAPELVWKIDKQFKAPEAALYDAKRDVIYVSNINGSGTDKDGNGFISKVTPEGKIVKLEWVGGLDAPKGLAISGNMLYVADITALIEIDIEKGMVTQRFEAAGAKFLNDVAAASDGTVYVSDMFTNTIHKLSDNKFTAWVKDTKLENPNGLLVEKDNLIVGSWGKITSGFDTDIPGHMKSVSLKTGEISTLGSTKSIGNLDGVEPDGKGNFYVTDWIAGKLLSVDRKGNAKTLLTLEKGSADLGIIPEKNLLIIPMMLNGSLLGYRTK